MRPGIGSLVRHMRFVVGHQGKIGGLAPVTDSRVASTIAAAADHVVHPGSVPSGTPAAAQVRAAGA